MNDATAPVIKTLIRDRHWTYATFCREWDKAAKALDARLVGAYPSRAQYYRWLKGAHRPYPDARRVLEVMFQGWSVDTLFAAQHMPVINSHSIVEANGPMHRDAGSEPKVAMLGVSGVYGSRADFLAAHSFDALLAESALLRSSGVSLNLLCQHYPDSHMLRLVQAGLHLKLLFLDPDSHAMQSREKEEGYDPGYLAGLTSMNIDIMYNRVRARLPPELHNRIQIALSDATVRFNVLLFDDDTGVVQPYLPEVRGVDSPTLFLRAMSGEPGLFETFAHAFESLWKRARAL